MISSGYVFTVNLSPETILNHRKYFQWIPNQYREYVLYEMHLKLSLWNVGYFVQTAISKSKISEISLDIYLGYGIQFMSL